MAKEENKLKIRIRNLEQDLRESNEKMKKQERELRDAISYLVENFKISMEGRDKEIKQLKEGRAKIEAELILKELKKLIALETKGKKDG